MRTSIVYTNKEIQLYWHRYYDKHPNWIASRFEITVDDLWERLKSLISPNEFIERFSFTGYENDRGVNTIGMRCQRCGLLVDPKTRKNMKGRLARGDISCRNCRKEVSYMTWEEIMYEAGWCEGLLPNIWLHESGQVFDETTSYQVGLFGYKTWGEYHRSIITTPIIIPKDDKENDKSIE
jgi:hypothetical protein